MRETHERWMMGIVGPRWNEVEVYALSRKIPVSDAIAELINKGLSHADPDPVLLCW